MQQGRPADFSGVKNSCVPCDILILSGATTTTVRMPSQAPKDALPDDLYASEPEQVIISMPTFKTFLE